MSGENPMQRLERAMELWIRYQAGEEPGSEAEFLARHEDLSDLLEPLLCEVEDDDDEAAFAPEDGEGMYGHHASASERVCVA